jgi:hypothetical protein
MHEFEGDLLIGGAKLSHIHGELEHEVEAEDHDWDFAGKILLHRHDCENLECERRYRLELADGRAGQVSLRRLEPTDDGHMVAEFVSQKPRTAK